jgi:hypothetical protein
MAKYAAFLVVEWPAFLGSDAFLEAGERVTGGIFAGHVTPADIFRSLNHQSRSEKERATAVCY